MTELTKRTDYIGIFQGVCVETHQLITGYLTVFPNRTNPSETAPVITTVDEMRAVIPETVGRCTGIKDKHGDLLFAGDLISIPGHTQSYLIVDADHKFELRHRAPYADGEIVLRLKKWHNNKVERFGVIWESVIPAHDCPLSKESLKDQAERIANAPSGIPTVQEIIDED